MRRIYRQKGMNEMNELQRYTALKLSCEFISRQFETILSVLLGRSFSCNTRCEDNNYWSVSTTNDTFTNVEIVHLVKTARGGKNMLSHALPTDSNTSKSLEMDLCRALLQRFLKLKWEMEFVVKDALWIIGDFPKCSRIPEISFNLLSVESRVIDCNQLMSKDEFVEKLFSQGGTFTDLAALCEVYEYTYGTPLYWMYPITDGIFNGCYFVVVREGVLVLSYNVIGKENHEVFERESVHMCSTEEMRCFRHDWNLRASELSKTITSLLSFLERKEAQQDA